MQRIVKVPTNYPLHVPMNYSGKITCRVVQKTDRLRNDGTGALYIRVFLNGDKKMLPLHLYVKPDDFHEQRVRKSHKQSNDYNLLIEKVLADINTVEVNYRLGGVVLTIEKLTTEIRNPSSRLCFVAFWTQEMVKQRDILKAGTYRQQMSMLEKLRRYKPTVMFQEINEDFLVKIKKHFKTKLNNQDITINSFIKSFKKYLHLAQRRGIITPLSYEDISVKDFKGNRTFLDQNELRNLNEFWNDKYINPSHKAVLSQFLFACFTGLRFNDVQNLSPDNFIGSTLVFKAEKTQKLQRLALTRSALQYIDPIHIFPISFTNEHVNRELKTICKFRGITKKVTFHVSRHTFATNFLLSGGRVEHLQKLLGHSMIRETMVYVHIVESITDRQIHNMDEILFNKD